MSLSVIGAGFGRTGTMSLKMALEQLGFGPCHHMEEVFANPAQLAGWQAAAAGEPVDWDQVLDGYRSSIDWPSAHYWRQLAAANPEAKVVLSVRPVDRWWASFSGTIAKVLEMREEIGDPNIRAIAAMAHTIISEQTFSGALTDEATARAAFEQRSRDVQAALPAERLLVFDVTEGWGPLCAFLDCPVPPGDFPRSNSHDEFWQKFGAGLE